MPTKDCKRLVDRGKERWKRWETKNVVFDLDFDQINEEIQRAEKNLKENVKKLYDAEKKPEIRGLNLKSLSREERQELDQLLEPYIWHIFISRRRKKEKGKWIKCDVLLFFSLNELKHVFGKFEILDKLESLVCNFVD